MEVERERDCVGEANSLIVTGRLVACPLVALCLLGDGDDEGTMKPV